MPAWSKGIDWLWNTHKSMRDNYAACVHDVVQMHALGLVAT